MIKIAPNSRRWIIKHTEKGDKQLVMIQQYEIVINNKWRGNHDPRMRCWLFLIYRCISSISSINQCYFSYSLLRRFRVQNVYIRQQHLFFIDQLYLFFRQNEFIILYSFISMKLHFLLQFVLPSKRRICYQLFSRDLQSL